MRYYWREEKKMTSDEKKKFAARAIAWSLFACVCPVAFIGWRYDLFKKAGSLQLSGWGMIAVIIIAVFLIAVAKYVKAGFNEWSMTKQILEGVLKVVLPLGALLAVCVSIRNNIDYFIQALGCTLLCEVIAIPLNPFPEWVYNKTKGRFESAVDYVSDKLYSRSEKKEG